MSSSLVWFRRDLRDFDHAVLSAAASSAASIHCAFVFDTDLLTPLPSDDRRLSLIHAALTELDSALRARGGGLIVRHGRPVEEIPRLAERLGVAQVLAARDYEPYARRRDQAVVEALRPSGRVLRLVKDQVIFEPKEVVKPDGTPYTVFTPYRNAWRARLERESSMLIAAEPALAPGQLAPLPSDEPGLPALSEIGFQQQPLVLPAGMAGGRALLDAFLERIDRYHLTRDLPALQATSRLSPHLRFGTVSIRALVSEALRRPSEGAGKWLDELIWREFYQMILWQRPDVIDHCFRPEYDALLWRNDKTAFEAWCAGQTGYPLVDAAMRELAATGWMHNRLRMVCASFLTKHLGIDWRWGEAWFARLLLDYDLAANNGGWQWSASTGCDAQPYFRIFNPVSQSEKFDPQGAYLCRWLPELAAVPVKRRHAPWLMSAGEQAACGVVIGHHYPAPIVDHAAARQEALARFAAVKKTA